MDISCDNITNPDFIEYQHNEHKNNIDLALDLVKNYIIENKLIIVGGMSIDFALQTLNKKLYEDCTIPDFDIYTDEFIYHSDKLSNILCNKKIPNISMIPAIHNSTIRVKMSGYTVFDVTYVPTNIIKLLPTIKYLDFIIIDPNYQKIDQCNSLSFLFEITGSSYNVFHRFKKDICRNKILVDNFNITDSSLIHSKIKTDLVNYTIPLELFNDTTHTFNIFDKEEKIHNIADINDEKVDYFYNNENSYFETDHDLCIHGITAYSFYYTQFKKILTEFDTKYQNNDIIKKINIDFNKCINSNIKIIEKNNKLFLNSDIQSECHITFNNSNNNIDNLLNEFKKYYKFNDTDIDKYNRIIDIKPVSIIIKKSNLEIIDLYSKLLSVNLSNLTFNGKKYNFIISNYNYILSYFLINYYFNDKNNEIYLHYYSSLITIITMSHELFNLDNELFEKTNGQKFNNSMFNYSISTFGLDNFTNSYFYFIKNFEHLYEFGRNSTLKPNSNHIEYPKCKESKQSFEIDNSEFFKLDGLLNNDMKYTNYAYMLKK